MRDPNARGTPAFGEDVTVSGRVARGEATQSAEEVGGSTAANREDSRDSKQGETREGGFGEGGRKEGEEGADRLGHQVDVLLDLATREASLASLTSLTTANLPAFTLGQTLTFVGR